MPEDVEEINGALETLVTPRVDSGWTTIGSMQIAQSPSDCFGASVSTVGIGG